MTDTTATYLTDTERTGTVPGRLGADGRRRRPGCGAVRITPVVGHPLVRSVAVVTAPSLPPATPRWMTGRPGSGLVWL